MSMTAIILAAGKGTRMKSELPKVAHEVAGKPMIHYVIDAVNAAQIDQVYLVVGHEAETIKKMTSWPNVAHVLQAEQLGTGHAVMQAAPFLEGKSEGLTVILAGDCPLITHQTLEAFLNEHRESQAVCSVLTTKMPDAARYGRILRDNAGAFLGIKEAKDCNEEELAINEINSGIFAVDTQKLFEALKKINTNNAQQEYYLTDVCHILKSEGEKIIGYCIDDPAEVMGINTKIDLAEVTKEVFQRRNRRLMSQGVTLVDPCTTFIDETVTFGKDCTVYPFTVIQGESRIGDGAQIGPHTYIKDRVVEANAKVLPLQK